MPSVVPRNFRPPVKEKPFWLKLWNRDAIITFFGTIYVEKERVRDLRFPTRPLDESLIVHETFHAWRQKEVGMWVWHWRYLTSREFRWKEERTAYEAQFACLRGYGKLSQYLSEARLLEVLTSDAYGHMVSMDEAAPWLSTQFAMA